MAIRDLAARGDVDVVFPVHLNPAVRDVVVPLLSEVKGVHLCEPLGYLAFVDVLDSADLVLTDSGGLQEEAPSLGSRCSSYVTRPSVPKPYLLGWHDWSAPTD